MMRIIVPCLIYIGWTLAALAGWCAYVGRPGAPVGTRSVLYGYHCVALHWAFCALGWLECYGLRRVYIGDRTVPDFIEEHSGVRYPSSYRRPVYASVFNPRLWLAFLVHDLGYWGSSNMDGAEGERHPEWAARVMGRWFGEPWGTFCLYHSRFYAKRDNAPVSPLCFADKLAITWYPEWLMIRLVAWTGEVKEYMQDATRQNAMRQFQGVSLEEIHAASIREWFRGVKAYVRAWVAEHKDGRADTWTPATRQALDETGVWK